MSELLNMTSFNERGAQSTLRRMRVLATDIDTMLQCKLLSMAPSSARTAVAGTDYQTAEQLAEALDAAIEKDRLTLSAASLPSSAATEDIDMDLCRISHTKQNKSKQQSRGSSSQQNQNSIICFYHERFGYKAKRCTGPPCKFAGMMQQENCKASN